MPPLSLPSLRASCHQCKSSKSSMHLLACSSRRSLTADGKRLRDCKKKYCAVCLPEHDTRVLTDAGFLFLSDIEQRLNAGQQVLYACYDVSTSSIVYSTGTPVCVSPPERWVDFTHAGTRSLWDETSDDYGATVPANGVVANRLTLRTTPEHDMYVQLCTGYQKDGQQQHEPRMAGFAPIPPHKMTAVELAPGFQCDCVAAGRTCTHGYSHYRIYTGAASGLHTPANMISLTDRSDPQSPVVALDLLSRDEVDAFLELFGYWLGDGSVSYDSHADMTSDNAVCFVPRKVCDSGFLLDLLARLHLVRGQHFTTHGSDRRLELRITELRWFRFFDREFGAAQRSSSTVPASTTASVSVASSTRARSVSGSGSFSDSASVSVDLNDYSSDDMSSLEVEVEDDVASARAIQWLPDWLLFRLDAQQLRLVIEGLRQAAGSSVAGDQAKRGEYKICTSSVVFRDQLIHACMHAGYSAYFELNSCAAVARGYHDSWSVCYSEMTSEMLPAQDVRFDGSACRVKLQAASIETQPANLYDEQRDGRVWCVKVEHDDHLIFVQRAHRNAESGVVTKAGRTMVTGNCLDRWYGLDMEEIKRKEREGGPGWRCPACEGICPCAACRRKGGRKREEGKDGDEDDTVDGSDDEEETDRHAKRGRFVHHHHLHTHGRLPHHHYHHHPPHPHSHQSAHPHHNHHNHQRVLPAAPSPPPSYDVSAASVSAAAAHYASTAVSEPAGRGDGSVDASWDGGWVADGGSFAAAPPATTGTKPWAESSGSAPLRNRA